MNTFKIKFSLQKVSVFCFFLICFILTRQVPFSALSPLSNVAIIFLFITQIPKDKYYIFFTLILIGLGGYSLAAGNNIPTIIRFIIILWSICTAYYIKLPINIIKIVVYLSLIQCFVLIGIEVFMITFSNDKLYALIRNYVMQIGCFYKIQIKGNAILPFVYMLSFCQPIFPKKFNNTFKIILLISVLCSGQFAFIIALAIFHLYLLFKDFSKNTKKFLYIFYAFILMLAILCIPIYNYVKSTLEMKSEESSAIRIEQAELLLKDLDETPFTLLLGKGLGNTISIQTPLRDYTDNIYFELQIIYILNQIGLLSFILYILYNIYLTIKKIKYKELIFIYLFYIVYAITNPYIFDTHHIVVILTLCSISNYLTNHQNKALCK